jgi:hypothetical protein
MGLLFPHRRLQLLNERILVDVEHLAQFIPKTLGHCPRKLDTLMGQYEYDATLFGESGSRRAELLKFVRVGLIVGLLPGTNPSNPDSPKLKLSCSGGDIWGGGCWGGGV